MESNLTGYPSIDKPWMRYYSEDARNAKVPECTIYESIYNHNKDYLQDVALLYFGKKITYKQLFAQVEKVQKAFMMQGVKDGDDVALCVTAIPEAVYAILALNKLGANAYMLNPTFTEQQLTERLNETDATVMLVMNELYERMENVLPNTKIKQVISCSAINTLGTIAKVVKKVKKIDKTIPWNKFISEGRNVKNICKTEYKKDAPAIIVYSSGSTGAAKGIQLTNYGVNASIVDGGFIGFEWKRQDRYFCEAPIWASTGISATLLVPLYYGITVILEPKYDFELLYQHIEKYRPNFMITATGLLDYLMQKKEYSIAYREFKYLVVGGEYVTPWAEQKFNEWLQRNGSQEKLHKGYGMCECGSTVTATHYNCNKSGSAGIPTPNVIVAAFDLKTDNELKYGQRGELRVLTRSKMLGYYKKEKATKEKFFEDEQGRRWVRTGDMGYVTEDGSVYVDGRISSSYINENNETIYLFDIERAILDIEQVRQCKAVVSEIDGRRVHVVHMSLVDDADVEKTLSRVKVYCTEKLAISHFPTLVKLHDSALPIALSQKLDVAKMEKDIDGLISL